MSDLRFKVGAAVDASWDVVFGKIVDKAKKARVQIAAEMGAGAKGLVGPYRSAASDASGAIGKVGAAAKDTAAKSEAAGRSLGRMADGAADRFAALSKGLKAIPADLAVVAREAEREIARIERSKARQTLGLGGGGGYGRGEYGRDVGYRLGLRSVSTVNSTLHAGMNIARDLARGVGIDTDLGSLLGKSVEREDLATSLSIQGFKSYKAGSGDPNGTKVSAGTLSQEAFAHGNAVGMDPNEILKAQTAFVDLTGDLNTARGIMTDLGSVSNATGTDMTETATAAAGISKALEATFGNDTQGRIAATRDILRNLAGQGKEGAVELKNYASQMGKVAAAANQVGGDRKEAFNLVGMVVQESRAHGGSTSAVQAAGSVGALFAEIATDSTRKHPHLSIFNDLYNKDAQGHRTSLQSPVKIIEAAVLASHGDPTALRKMFSSRLASRAVEGFAGVYRDAERKTPGSGKAALEEELANLHKATISEQDVRDANVEKLNETKGQVQEINNGLAQVADKLRDSIAPKIQESGDELVSAAGHIADFVGWAAGNPWEAAGAAIVASVGKAGIEQGLRVAIEKMGAGSTIALSAATVLLTTGILAIDAAEKADAKAEGAAATSDAQANYDIARADARGTAADLPKLKADLAAAQAKVTDDRANVEAGLGDVFSHPRGALASIGTAVGLSDANDQLSTEFKEHSKTMRDLQRAIQDLTRKVGNTTRLPPRAPEQHSTTIHR